MFSLPTFMNSVLMKLLLASLLGALIGLERDAHGRAAGLRTHLLVSLGSTVFMLLSQTIALANAELNPDPARIAAQIITGVGFLGAGTIIKSGLSVRGLTTAACLWLTAGIGMTIGAGYFYMGIVTTIIGLFALVTLNKLENFYAKDFYRTLEIKTSGNFDTVQLKKILEKKGLHIMHLNKERDFKNNIMKINLTVKIHHRQDITEKISNEIISDLEEIGDELYKLKWTHQ